MILLRQQHHQLQELVILVLAIAYFMLASKQEIIIPSTNAQPNKNSQAQSPTSLASTTTSSSTATSHQATKFLTRTTTSRRTTATLAPTITPAKPGQWHIENYGQITFRARDMEIMVATMPFNASNRDHGARVLETDCITPITEDICPGCYDVNTTAPTSIAPDGYIQFDTQVWMNITELNNTGHFIPFAYPERGGWVAVCIETYLCFKEQDETGDLLLGNDPNEVTKVDVKNNLLILSINFEISTNFNIGTPSEEHGGEEGNGTIAGGSDGGSIVGGIELLNPYENIPVINGTTEDRDIFIAFSEYIKAYECEESDLYHQRATGKVYNQGDEIMVCVTEESNHGIVQVDKFYELKVSQPGTISDYHYIKNTVWNPHITTPKCQDDTTGNRRRVCYVKFVALGRFFSSEDPPDLSITGSIFLLLGGRRIRRNLRTMTIPGGDGEYEYKKYRNKNNLEQRVGGVLPARYTASSSRSSNTRRDASLEVGGGEFEVKISLTNNKSPSQSASSNRIGGSTTSAAGLISIVVVPVGATLLLL